MSSYNLLQRSALGIAIGVALAGTLSCAQDGLPTYPAVVVPPVPPAADAKLAVDLFEVRFEGLASGRYWYRQRVVLTETSGNSGATLSSLAFVASTGEAGETISVRDCFDGPDFDQVSRGGTWSTDTVDYYCLGFGSRSDLAGKPILMTVDYLDDAGRKGSVTATTVVN